VCVLSERFNDEWIQLSGSATVVDLPSLGRARDLLRSISGEHSHWDEYRQAMIDQGNGFDPTVPETWGPISKGGFPARLARS